MADVTGQIIGNAQDKTKDVRLNNAATEATLKALLAAANIDSAVLREIARKAGVEPIVLDNLEAAAAASATSIQQATVSTQQLTVSQNRLKEHSQLVDSSFYGLIESTKLLASGNATVSGVLDIFRTMPGPLGLVAQGFATLAAFQETNMKTYQTMSTAGANFGGSLTDMRLAAQGAFVDLQTFGNLVKNNSQVLGRMGGSVDDGTQAFAAMSNSLLTSGAGEKLLALGYTTEDVNQGMLSYIATTGGRTKEEMKNTQAITVATSEYMTELDKLTQFTGVNRKTLEDDQKKAAAQSAFQRKLAGMSEEERAKTMAAYNAASASGIKGATDLVMSTTLGLPPMTEAARALSGALPETAAGFVDMTRHAMTVGTTMEGVNQDFGRTIEANQKNIAGLDVAGDAITMMPGKFGEVINSAGAFDNQMKSKNIKNADDAAKQMMDIQNKQNTQAKSQAATMASAEIQLKEFGLAIMKLISPIISVLTPVLTYLGPLFLGLASAVMLWKAGMMAKEFLKGSAGTAGRIAEEATGASRAASVASTAATVVPGAAAPPGGGILGGVLGSLAEGLKKMGNPQVLLGIVAVGLLGGAMMVAGKAFKEFTGVNWGDVLIGSVVLTALSIGAAALVEIAPFIGITAVAIGLLGGAIWLLAKGLKEFPTFAIPGMSEAFEGFGKIVGTVFGFVGDVVSGLIDTVKKVFGTVWDIISWPFKMIGNLISGTVDVVTNILGGLVNIVTGIFGTMWNIVSWPFKQLGNLISGTVDVVTSILGGLVNIVTGIFGTMWNIVSWPFKQLGNLISGTVSVIATILGGMVDIVTGLFGILWNVVSWPFKQLGNLISGTVSVIATILGGMVDIITGIFGLVWNIVSWPFKQLGNLVSGTINIVTGILGGIVDGISAIFGTVWNIISWPFKQLGNLISGTGDSTTGLFGGMLNTVTSIFGAVWNIISWPFKQLGNLISGTVDVVASILGGLVNIVTGIFGTMWNIISWPFKQLGNLVSSAVDSITGVFGSMVDGITGLFGTVWDAISAPFKMIGDLVSSVVDGITGVFGSMVDGISGAFGSVWTVISAPFTMIGDLVSSVVDGITGVFGSMVDIISGAFGTVWTVISAPFTMIGDLVSSVFDGIAGVFSGIVDSISGAFGIVWDIMSAPFKMIGDLVSSVFDGISAAISFVVDKLTNILGMIGDVIGGIAGFVGSLFGGGDKAKEGSGPGSPEFTEATSTLLEAANKLGSVSDKLATVNLGPRQDALPGSTAFDSIFKMALTASSVKKETADLPPLSEEAKKLSAGMFGDKGPSLEEKTHTELVSLNTTMKDLLRYIKDTADNTKKTHEATKSLNGNAFAI
jgi:phage-related protein